jgi:hypothetical protein
MPDDDSVAVAEFIRTKGITGAPLHAFCRPKRCLVPLTGLRWKNMRRLVIDCSEHEPRSTGENWYIPTVGCRRYRGTVRATATGPEKAPSGMAAGLAALKRMP